MGRSNVESEQRERRRRKTREPSMLHVEEGKEKPFFLFLSEESYRDYGENAYTKFDY